MDQKLRTFYLENQIKNATPGQLLIMLYDGLIQNAESADTELSSSENPGARVQASRFVSRCIDIMTELNTCLKHGVDPVLCGTLSDLYLFFTREFSEAYDKSEPGRIRAILPLIRELRTAWFEADREANKFEALDVEAAVA
jgi:flagellar secretion chaperone FliS